MTSNVNQGHIRPLLCHNHSSSFIYGPILMKILMNSIMLKTQFFKLNDLKCHFYVMEKFCDFFFTLLSDLITTLTYVFIDNFCIDIALRIFPPFPFYFPLFRKNQEIISYMQICKILDLQ